MSIFCWDFDGTLAYSEHLWSGSVFRALNETVTNHNVTFQDIRRCNASGFTWHIPEKDFTGLIGEKWWEFMNAHFYNSFISLGISESDARAASEKVRDIIMMPSNYNLFDDTVCTLKTAKEKGHTNIILSNNYPELQVITDALGITQYFDALIISGLVGYDKPRQEIFDIVKSYYKNENYVMIGDNPVADIQGGRAAGMTTVLVHKGFDRNADYCFDNLIEICSLM